ncbi:hypothetical protein AAMO2058_001121600 [Amorphochlora amoebiformis]
MISTRQDHDEKEVEIPQSVRKEPRPVNSRWDLLLIYELCNCGAGVKQGVHPYYRLRGQSSQSCGHLHEATISQGPFGLWTAQHKSCCSKVVEKELRAWPVRRIIGG